jgi:transposase
MVITVGCLERVRAFRFGVDCDVPPARKALMLRNAPVTETGRLRLARCVVDDGWPLRRAAERFQVSPTTAQRWAGRYRALGEAGMAEGRGDQAKGDVREAGEKVKSVFKHKD